MDGNNLTPLPTIPQQIITNTATLQSDENSNKKKFVVAGIVFLTVLSIGSYFLINKNSSKSTIVRANSSSTLQKVVSQNPSDRLSAALNKTIAVNTAYLEYKTKVASHVANAKTAVTQTLHNNVDGSISGSTDGKTMALEMKIYNDLTPDKSINVSVLNTENDEWYIRNAQTAPKWQKLTKKQYEEFNSAPIDASIFGLNILGTIFSNNQALFNSFNKDTVTSIGEEQTDNKIYNKYRVDVSTPDYIDALSKDTDLTQKEVDETKIILKDAILTVTYYIDNSTNYVTKLKIEGKKLTQIPSQLSQQLGISTTHDISLDAILSRFNVPTNISVPSQGDVLGTFTNLQKPTLVQ